MSDDDRESAAAGAKRAIGKPFQPGQSGNPGGRPRGAKAFQAALLRKRRKVSEVINRGLGSSDIDVALKAADLVCRYICPRPPAAITGAEGQPLFPQAGAPSDNPVSRLLALVSARRDAARVEGQPTSTAPASAPPGANGSEPERPS
jgi:hypothetical protein